MLYSSLIPDRFMTGPSPHATYPISFQTHKLGPWREFLSLSFGNDVFTHKPETQKQIHSICDKLNKKNDFGIGRTQ